MGVVSSPRRRRRLAWLAGVLVVVAAVAFVATLIPNTSGYQAETFSNRPVQRVISQRQVPVTPRRRAEVNALFDAFVPAAILRRNPEAAYDMLTEQGRSGQTRADFRRGDLPVFAYKARGSRFHGWTVDDSYRTSMDVELYLQPASPKDGPIDYAVGLKLVGGRWLIDSIYPRSSYAPPEPVARAGTETAPQPDSTLPQAKTGVVWILIGVLVAMVLAVPAVFVGVQWRSNRKNRSRFAD